MTEEITNYDNLNTGSIDLVTETLTVKQGENLVRGTVLGKITATGKMVIVDSTNTDGSENPYAVLVEDVDATSADVVSGGYVSGVFNENKLVFGGTDTYLTHKAAMRLLGMYIQPSLTTTGQNS